MVTAADTGDRAAARLLLAQVADEQRRLAGASYSRHPGGKLCELGFELDGEAVRIPYWLTPGHVAVGHGAGPAVGSTTTPPSS
jgi:hypothetical protein